MAIPCTAARRTAYTWAKLVTRVRRDATHGGFAFEGDFVRPGSKVPADRALLVLECAGFSKWAYEPDKRRPLYLYLLWRWEPATGEWMEAARAWSWTWDWSLDIGPVARRLLAEIHGPERVVNLTAVQRRIAALLDAELTAVDEDDRPALLAIIHDQLAQRIAAGV